MPRYPMTQRRAGLVHGWRSGLEESIGSKLKAAGVPFSFEEITIPFLQPQKPRKYTPDFVLLANGIIVESKGQFLTADRQKHLLVKEQHPDLDIRFVFSNPNNRISKKSKTTYALWCESKGFKYAKGNIPMAWLLELENKKSLAAIQKLKDSDE